ncbi:MAG: membrane protein insertion efficiency factor YidD [Candidatus Andersenbacteria bacterium]
MSSLFTTLNRAAALPLVGLTRLYQLTLSPDHGWYRALHPHGFCRYSPSCSQYALDGLRADGVLALPRIAARLVRCHPWAHGGADPYVAFVRATR